MYKSFQLQEAVNVCNAIYKVLHVCKWHVYMYVCVCVNEWETHKITLN